MKNIQALLKNKKLTGKEAARLIIDDNITYFMSNGKKRVLTPKDKETIFQAVQGDQHIRDFNAYMHIGQHIEETFVVLDAVKWNISSNLHQGIIMMLEKHILLAARRRDGFSPQVMTEKQYEDVRNLQRQRRLNEPVSLAAIIISFAEEAAIDEPTPEGTEPDLDHEDSEDEPLFEYEEDVNKFAKDYPEDYEAAYKKLMELIESEKLVVEIPPKRKLTPRSFSLLKKIIVRREALYRLGYWTEYIDTYDPNFNHEEGGSFGGVAIIQNPEPYQIDEKGHFIDRFATRHLYTAEQVMESQRHLWMSITSLVEKTRKALRSIYRYVAVVEAYSEQMEYNFRKHLDVVLNFIKDVVDVFNGYLDENKIDFPFDPTKSEEPLTIDLSSLEPSPEAVKAMKESIDIHKEPWAELFDILRKEGSASTEYDEEYP